MLARTRPPLAPTGPPAWASEGLPGLPRGIGKADGALPEVRLLDGGNMCDHSLIEESAGVCGQGLGFLL